LVPDRGRALISCNGQPVRTYYLSARKLQGDPQPRLLPGIFQPRIPSLPGSRTAPPLQRLFGYYISLEPFREGVGIAFPRISLAMNKGEKNSNLNRPVETAQLDHLSLRESVERISCILIW